MDRVLIGVDAGGSKTSAVVAEGETVLARTTGPGAAMRPGRALASATTITDVARHALAEARRPQAELLVVGAAGAGRAPEREELGAALRSEGVARRVVVTTDIEIALAAAFGEAPGMVVSGGTGSVAAGRGADGALVRMGGYGWQMGDEGSGYAIGRAALGTVSRARDGRGPATALSDRLLAATRSEDFDALVRWAAGANAAEVAALAPHVLEVAAQGDVVAQGIADYAARELSQLALCLRPLLQGNGAIPVVLAGGLLESSAGLRRAVRQKLDGGAGVRVMEQTADAALGALALARRLDAGGDERAIR
ncbi:MAG TPA: BadF/BadG/BcrA/BcrD ATPase family protein [Gemmatimonadales bacterium]|nr:BadF/BadG/BcrA/BcrD ATPase family protein [Gemmatimonadales bacterium]